MRNRLERASPAQRLPLAAQCLESLRKRLQSASPASVLNRGFVLMRDEKGKPVVRKSGARPGRRLSAEFADGKAAVRVES